MKTKVCQWVCHPDPGPVIQSLGCHPGQGLSSCPSVFGPVPWSLILSLGFSSYSWVGRPLFCCVILSNVLGSCPRGRHPVLGSVILAQGPPSCSRDGQTVSGFVSLVSPRLYCLFQDMSPCLWVWHFVPGYVTRFLGLSARSV